MFFEHAEAQAHFMGIHHYNTLLISRTVASLTLGAEFGQPIPSCFAIPSLPRHQIFPLRLLRLAHLVLPVDLALCHLELIIYHYCILGWHCFGRSPRLFISALPAGLCWHNLWCLHGPRLDRRHFLEDLGQLELQGFSVKLLWKQPRYVMKPLWSLILASLNSGVAIEALVAPLGQRGEPLGVIYVNIA